MPSQLNDVPGSIVHQDGSLIFLQKKLLFATWVYPVAVIVFFLAGQPFAAWLTLAAGVYTHGLRYPRVYEAFYPIHFYLSAVLVVLLPVLHLMLSLSTGVTITDGR